MILGIVDDSKDKSNLRSVEGYGNALELSYFAAYQNNPEQNLDELDPTYSGSRVDCMYKAIVDDKLLMGNCTVGDSSELYHYNNKQAISEKEIEKIIKEYASLLQDKYDDNPSVDLTTLTVDYDKASVVCETINQEDNLIKLTKCVVNNNLVAYDYSNKTVTNKGPVMILPNLDIVSVSAGNSHSLAIDSEGNLWAWGYNGYGQLGNGTTTQSKTPVQIKSDITFPTVAAG